MGSVILVDHETLGFSFLPWSPSLIPENSLDYMYPPPMQKFKKSPQNSQSDHFKSEKTSSSFISKHRDMQKTSKGMLLRLHHKSESSLRRLT